jgi:Na+/melibiose symporter-like transporter
MTIRSIIIGIFLGVLLCGVTFFNDMVMKGTPLIGNFLPISVFGLLLLFVVLINPLMGRVMRAAVLSGGELATIVAIALFACCIPGRGLMQYFTTFLMMPHFHERTTPAWQSEPGIITYDQVQDWEALTAVRVLGGFRWK